VTKPTGSAESNAPPGADRLLIVVYDELRRLARVYLKREGGYQTLGPTALVHEAYLRLARRTTIRWRGKTHFLAVAASEMRRVLVERARAADARKRGARPARVALVDDLLVVASGSTDLLALDEALRLLAVASARQARVAEMRLFADLPVREISAALCVSERTVKDDWRMARAWIARALRGQEVR
jgi:RNA polymerase sigma factor (TIGR02999 family)